MSDLDKLFCKVGVNYIEGYLDDENHDPELLFVLKEPDASAKNVTDFWFKRNVMPNPQGLGKTYFKVLGETARKLIGNQIKTIKEIYLKNKLNNIEEDF